MADETVKLILELENKSKKEFETLNKELKELKKQAKGADKEVEDLDNSLEKTGKTSTTTSKNVSSSGVSLKGLGVAAVAAAASLAVVVANSISLNKELRELATVSGLGFENFQLINSQALALGITADDTSSAINDLTLKIDEAAKLGSGAAVDAFKILGININEIASQDQVQRLETFRDALAGVDEQTRRLIFDELGSDSLIKFGNALDDINLNLDDLRDSGEISIITDEESERIAELNSELSKISTEFSVLGSKLTADIAPVLVQTLKDLRELIELISKSDSFDAASRFIGILKTLLSSTAQFAVSLTSVFGEFLFFLGNKIPSSLTNLVLKINELGSKIGVEILSEESVKEFEDRLAVLEFSANKRLDNIKDDFKEFGEAVGDNVIDVAINANFDLTGDERVLLQDLLDGQVEYVEQFERARTIVERTFDDSIVKQQILNDLLKKQVQFETNRIETQSTGSSTTPAFAFSLGGFEEELRKAQIELLKLQGSFEKAFDLDVSETNEKLGTLNDQIKTAQEIIASGSGTEKLKEDLKSYQEQSEALTQLLELQKQQAILQETQFDQQDAEQKFDLDLIDEEQLIAEFEKIQLIIAETFGEDSVELAAFREQFRLLTEELDTFGQISLKVFEDFSAGFATAVTDSLLSGKSLSDGLGNLFASIAEQLLQAVIQALIFSAIMSSFGLGGGQSFGQLFESNLAGSFGVTTRHNGGVVGREGDSGNSIKNINIADPSGSLNPNERFIIAKTDESVVKTSSLNSPTGIGSNQPTQPEVKINNYITDDVLNAFLTSDAAQDTIVNIVNNNNDRIR